MRHRLVLAALALTTLIAAKSPDQELKKALEGRVAGEPVSCIDPRDIRSTRIIDGIGILYDVGRRTVYLNLPRSGARFLDWSDVLVTTTTVGGLCNLDLVQLIDPTSRIPTGTVGLGKFVPYRKVETR